MGVTGSNCQLCGLPLHHDHYVPTGGAMLKIYRTGSEGGGHDFEEGERVVPFGPEHAWLCDAVAVSRLEAEGGVIRGTVVDGVLENDSGGHVFIWKGDDEGFAYHHACWTLMGAPSTEADCVRAHGLYAWAVIEPYDEQLWEHAEFRDHGFGWMLEDPKSSPRSRARIEAMLARAKARPGPDEPLATVRAVVRAEHGWKGAALRDEDNRTLVHIVRWREGLNGELDTAIYPTLVRAMNDITTAAWPGADNMQELIDYEAAIVAAVERDDGAIVLMTTVAANQTQYLIQARDEAATRALLEALPRPACTKPIEFDNEQDPAWNKFYTMMNPRLYRD